MKRTGRFVARALVASSLAFGLALALAACTGDGGEGDGEPDPTGATGRTGATGPTSTGPAPVTTGPGSRGTYEYVNAGLRVVVRIVGSGGTMEVTNGTEHDLPEPDLYVLDARDGTEIPGEVLDPAVIPAGEEATFEVALEGVEVRNIGLLVLLFGADNFGAFVRTA